ncbi:hypothetical protein JL720_16455 [Aureococcus anophagefferens]|nr:hypothetical protein JL720_16455 [Aureococcus anophagefferens]
MTVRPEETRAMREALGQDPLTGEPKWLKRQRKLFTNFVNAKLMDRDISPVTNIFEDLKDGRILCALLEELSGQSLAPIGKIKKKAPLKKAETRIDHVSNLSIVFRYINQTTKITGIGPGRRRRRRRSSSACSGRSSSSSPRGTSAASTT